MTTATTRIGLHSGSTEPAVASETNTVKWMEVEKYMKI